MSDVPLRSDNVLAAPPPAADAGLALLCAGLEALATPLLLLDQQSRIVYLTKAAGTLLQGDEAALRGRSWPDVWTALCVPEQTLSDEPQRATLRIGGRTVSVRAWQRPLAGTLYRLVGLDDLTAEDVQEREVLRIFRDVQQQADDLFALYQITQFLNTAQELDQLCTIFLQELTRRTGAVRACLYLAAPTGLVPKVWHGLPAPPPPQPDSDQAAAWFRDQAALYGVLVLPLPGEDRLVGLALLAHPGGDQESGPGRKSRFLHTVAKEMGTALLLMAGRQALLAQEQKLEAIVAGTTDAIIQVGPDRRVLDFNHAAESLTGYSAAEAMTGTCATVFGCDHDGGCGGACPFVQVLTTRQPIAYTELTVAGRAGRHPATASVAALDLDSAGPAAVGILRDVSKQKQIEQMKADFLAAVSHQLRTPLALLRGYSDTLLHLDLSPQEQRACIAGIGETTTRMEHLVAQVLDVTRIEDGRLQLEREPVRLVDVVRAALSALPHTAYRSRIWAELAPDLPLVDADPQRLEQVLINLLDNALKYSPPTGQVVIRAQPGDGVVRVQVLDEGIGVPEQEREAVFGRFHRAGNVRHLQVSGNGLGLFICRSIVEAHGGEIALDSAPGAGTAVTFTLPRAAKGA